MIHGLIKRIPIDVLTCDLSYCCNIGYKLRDLDVWADKMTIGCSVLLSTRPVQHATAVET